MYLEAGVHLRIFQAVFVGCKHIRQLVEALVPNAQLR